MKKLKINACLEPIDEWTYETYVSDYVFENVSIEESLDNITIDGCKFSKCQFKDCSFSFIECMDIVFDHCEFENVHFNQCSLSRVHFISCRISGIEISQSLNQDVLIQLCKGIIVILAGVHLKIVYLIQMISQVLDLFSVILNKVLFVNVY